MIKLNGQTLPFFTPSPGQGCPASFCSHTNAKPVSVFSFLFLGLVSNTHALILTFCPHLINIEIFSPLVLFLFDVCYNGLWL